MSILFDNNSSATLSVQAEIVDTTLTLQTNEGQLFPEPTGGDSFICTLEDTSGNIEIVSCTANDALQTLTVTRAQENTTAKVFPTGSKVELRATAGAFNAMLQKTGGSVSGEVDMNDNILRDPLITDGEARNLTLRGTDGGTGNQLSVPTAGGAPTIGGSAIVTAANAGTYSVPITRSVLTDEGITGGGVLSANLTLTLDYPGMTTYAGGGDSVQGNDYLAVYDTTGTEHKKILYQEAGVPIETETGTVFTPADADMNRYFKLNNAAAITVNLNTTVGQEGNILLLEQTGAGQVTVAGTATVNTAFGTQATANQYSVICLVCTATNTWTLYGDVA